MKTQIAQQLADTFSADALTQIAEACESYVDILRRTMASEPPTSHYFTELLDDREVFRRAAASLRIIEGYCRPPREAAD